MVFIRLIAYTISLKIIFVGHKEIKHVLKTENAFLNKDVQCRFLTAYQVLLRRD